MPTFVKNASRSLSIPHPLSVFEPDGLFFKHRTIRFFACRIHLFAMDFGHLETCRAICAILGPNLQHRKLRFKNPSFLKARPHFLNPAFGILHAALQNSNDRFAIHPASLHHSSQLAVFWIAGLHRSSRIIAVCIAALHRPSRIAADRPTSLQPSPRNFRSPPAALQTPPRLVQTRPA